MDKVRAMSKKINQKGDQEAAAEPEHEARTPKPDPQPAAAVPLVPAQPAAPTTVPAHVPEPETGLNRTPQPAPQEHAEKHPPDADEPPPVQTPNPISGT